MDRAPSRSRQRVAGALGYEYVDQQLPVVVAKRLRITPEDVEANEDAQRTLGERLLDEPRARDAGAGTGVGRRSRSTKSCSRAVQDAVREYAARGDAVIVGRGASAILGARPDVLRVFMHAPREWRIARIVEATRRSAGDSPRPRSIASIALASPTSASGTA